MHQHLKLIGQNLSQEHDEVYSLDIHQKSKVTDYLILTNKKYSSQDMWSFMNIFFHYVTITNPDDSVDHFVDLALPSPQPIFVLMCMMSLLVIAQ